MPDLGAALGSPLVLAAALACGYFLGSIPFGLLLTQVAGTADIRSIGSGNIGATNVLRTGRKGLAAATLILDVLKGTAAVLLADWAAGRPGGLAAGIGAVLGHLWPVWLQFRGGKGVATYLGVLAGTSWPSALVFAALWAAVAAITRYSSLAALVASAATPLALWFWGERAEALVFLLLTALIFVRHQGNIRRLFAGSESKIGGNK